MMLWKRTIISIIIMILRTPCCVFAFRSSSPFGVATTRYTSSSNQYHNHRFISHYSRRWYRKHFAVVYNTKRDNNNNNNNNPLLKSLSRPNHNTYWVIPGKLLAGEYPSNKHGIKESKDKLNQYLNHNITFFLDLTHEGEREEYKTLLYEEAKKSTIGGGGEEVEVEHCRIPIEDFNIPTINEMKLILNTIDTAIEEKNHNVYVHCRGGIGRTGTTIGCYLKRHYYNDNNNNQNSDDDSSNNSVAALDELNRLFQYSGRSYESSYSPETNDQIQFVLNWDETKEEND